MGITCENIHVILSFKAGEGIPLYFQEFSIENKQARFFFYSDNRNNYKYLSSIRPHILKQHFEKFPELSNEVICYHDSDILFRERLDESLLEKTDYWYFSDTRNYISSVYLKRFGNDFFEELCNTVNIDPKLVELNEKNSGGAQHIMKGVDAAYWQRVESDSETIHAFIHTFNESRKGNLNTPQAWCADMWAVLWNAWKLGKQVRLHSELEFSWPKDHISRYYKCKIFHNSGVFSQDKREYFCKLLFKESTPYDVDHSSVRKDSCSIIFVEQIQRLARRQKKDTVSDCTLVINLKSLIDTSTQARFEQYINYLYKYISIDIHIVEKGEWIGVNQNLVKERVRHYLIGKSNIDQHIKKKVRTTYFIYLDANVLLPVKNILSAIELLRKKDMTFVSPMNEVREMTIHQYDLFKDTFSKGLDKSNWKAKGRLDYLESFAMSKNAFVESGGNNEEWHYFYEDGFNLEREYRLRCLRFTIEKVELTAFKLFSNEHNSELEKKNCIERYLTNSQGTYDDLKRKIASRYYGYNKPYHRKVKIRNLLGGICSLKPLINISSFINKIGLNFEINIKEIKMYENNVGCLNFHDVISESLRNKLDFIIFLNESIIVENRKAIEAFWKAIEEMDYYGLQMLTALNGGDFKRNRKLSNQLFYIENFPSSSCFIIHKSLFNRILYSTFESDKSLENNLNLITEHFGMVAPFIGRPEASNKNDEKYIQLYKDKIKHISRVEDQLSWILEND